MKLSDLILDDATGGMSSTRLWLHIGNAAMLALFVRIGWNSSAGDGVVSLFLVFGGLVTGNQIASRILGQRAGVPGSSTEVTKTTDTRTTAAPTLGVPGASEATHTAETTKTVTAPVAVPSTTTVTTTEHKP